MLNTINPRYEAPLKVDMPELGQAKIRLWNGVFIVPYFLFAFLWDGTLQRSELASLASIATYYALGAAILAWVIVTAGVNHLRRRVASLLDMGATTLIMLLVGDVASPMFGMYLWVMIGNGFRFGRWYLHYTQILAVAGFTAVLLVSDYWHQLPILGVGLLLTLIAVPWYFSLLLSRLQQARAEAEAANIAKTKFLAAASHDLRQPMQALSMYVTVLEQRLNGHSALSAVHGVRLSVSTLERMFDSLLDISKIESGIVKPSVTTFALMPLLERVADAERAIAMQKKLELRLVSTSATVRSDPALLERMLKNLVTNAIRYTERGKVLIGCRRLANDRLRLDVIDSGIGIAPEEQERIFDEYYQLSGSAAQGLGLGLAIVKSLGELLGHAVSVKSTPDRGSVFSIELQRAGDLAVTSPIVQTRAAELIKLKVVLIDDDVEIRKSMGLLLESWGCQTITGGTVAEIEVKLTELGVTPNALIVDYRLADSVNGVQVIERLREGFGKQVPALIITGTANVTQFDTGAIRIPFAMKPVAPGRLRAFLSQAVRQA